MLSTLFFLACSSSLPTAPAHADADAARVGCDPLARDLGACLATGLPLADCAPTANDPGRPTYDACCVGVDARACDATCASTTPLALAPVASPALASAAATFTAGCGLNGTWCALSAPTASTFAACTDTDVVLDDVVAAALAPLQIDPSAGAQVSLQDLEQHAFFSSSYSTGAADLRLALEGWSRGTPLAWESTGETSCHNCTGWSSQIVLYWPLTGDVVLLDGSWGWDS